MDLLTGYRLLVEAASAGANVTVFADEFNKALEGRAEGCYTVERWSYDDAEEYVYGELAEVESDVAMKDGVFALVEIAAAVRHGDISIAMRKAELYQRAAGRRMDRISTPYIDDRRPDAVRKYAERLGIKIVARKGRFYVDPLFAPTADGRPWL
ncbi:MAG: hypothetical protein AT707_00240 [Pyrobaculum sp. JCHS_4]|jgi:Uncharacterized conserved protein containing a coiled-coil domain|nr:MAG: hypothetical protein AT707_00240 [Pyrobaculum sp. JCHS_4]